MTTSTTTAGGNPAVAVCHIIKGELIQGADTEYGAPRARFATPGLAINQLVWSRREPPPAAETPVGEIMDVLEQLGQWLSRDPRGLLAEALENSLKTGTLPRHVMEAAYGNIGTNYNRPVMEFQINRELGGADILDGWREITDTPSGRPARVRAYPPRLIHIIAGNAPGVSASTVLRGALTKGVHLLKLPSNDLYTATAILRGLADVAPGHPLTRSFSAVYWRGGDEAVEGVICRPQYFDKVVAWGGEGSIRGIGKYIGPGFELVSFDPKTSISLIGHEAFESDRTLAEVAEMAAVDATLFNQQACSSSRIQFVEGSVDEIDRYCELLRQRMAVDRPTASAKGPRVSGELRNELDGLSMLEPLYRVWGGYDGEGVVIRSEEPVDFHPDGKMVNVVPVKTLFDAVQFANVATQTVGVYPPARKKEVRDSLACAGIQRVVNLGDAGCVEMGIPHDGFNPLQRFVRWVNDEG